MIMIITIIVIIIYKHISLSLSTYPIDERFALMRTLSISRVEPKGAGVRTYSRE